MRPFLRTITVLILLLLFQACGNKTANTTEQNTLSEKIIAKIELRTTLTSDQKEKIATLASTSGLTAEDIKNKSTKPKYKALMKQIKKTILTPEQRAAIKKK